MPIRRNNDFKIRSGLHTDMSDSAYLISNFPVQSDMGRAKWSAPALAIPPQPAELVEMQDGSLLPNGFYTFEWRFSYWTFGMYNHWHTELMPGGVYAADVTVVLFDDFDNERIWQAAIQHRFAADREKAYGGYMNVIYRFVDAVDVTP